jgi:hypothetical protein
VKKIIVAKFKEVKLDQIRQILLRKAVAKMCNFANGDDATVNYKRNLKYCGSEELLTIIQGGHLRAICKLLIQSSRRNMCFMCQLSMFDQIQSTANKPTGQQIVNRIHPVHSKLWK